MITRDELSLFLLDFLNCSQYQDYAPNGLQVEGKDKIKRICTAVSASEDVISQAIEQQADALLVHHGYFWKGENPVISGMKRRRIAKLLGHNMNLFAYHLPLDCHPELGNNASLANLLLIDSPEMHRVNNTANLLWSGKLSKSMNNEQFSSFLEHKLGRYPVHIAGNKK